MIVFIDALVEMEKAMKRDRIEVNDRQVYIYMYDCDIVSKTCIYSVSSSVIIKLQNYIVIFAYFCRCPELLVVLVSM